MGIPVNRSTHKPNAASQLFLPLCFIPVVILNLPIIVDICYSFTFRGETESPSGHHQP